MSEWVDVHIDSIMNDTASIDGKPILGLAHYLNLMLENQHHMREILEQIDFHIRSLDIKT